MTIIAGYKTSESVVIAADSAATLGGVTGNTIVQQTEKLEIIGDNCIVGVSGPVGFAQRAPFHIREALGKHARLLGERNAVPVMKALRTALWDGFLSQEFSIAATAASCLGDVARRSVLGSFLVAVAVGNEPRLFEFDQQGAPEEIRQGVPFSCIGSGKSLADPLIGFARHHFWRDRSLMKTSDAVFILLWALKEAVRLSPGGICEPIRIAVLEREGSDFRAHALGDEQQEHEQWVNSLASMLPTAFDEWCQQVIGERGDSAIPAPPSSA